MPVLLFLALFLLGGEAMAFRVESPAFQNKGKIPAKYTCDGQNISPPLTWKAVPAGAKSFVLISEDTDAPVGTWVHWVLYDIPSETQELSEGVEKAEALSTGAKHGLTDFREVGYGGPCPPAGKPHRYFFKMYALDQALNLPPKMSKAELLVAMNGHVLAHAELVGHYQRS